MSTTKRSRVQKMFSRKKIEKTLRILRETFRQAGNSSEEISRLEELADAQAPLGDSLVHIAIYSTGKDESNLLRQIIEPIDKDNLLDIYLVRNKNEFTALDEAIHNKSVSKSQLILESLTDDEQRVALLNSCNRRGWTALHRAIYENNCELLKKLMYSVKQGMRRELVLRKDNYGTNVLQQSFSSLEMFKCILECCTSEDRSKILLSKDQHDSTMLHNIVLKRNADQLKWAIEKADSRHEFFKSPDAEGKTLLHLAVENGDIRMVRCLIDFVEHQTARFTMFYQTDNRQQTALHYAASVIDVETKTDKSCIMKILLESIKSRQQRHMLLQQEDSRGYTVLVEAQRVGNVEAIANIAKLVDAVDPLLKKQPSITRQDEPRKPSVSYFPTPDIPVVTATQVEDNQAQGAAGTQSVSPVEINNKPDQTADPFNKLQADYERSESDGTEGHSETSQPTVKTSVLSVAVSASGSSSIKNGRPMEQTMDELKYDSPLPSSARSSMSFAKPDPLTLDTPTPPPRSSRLVRQTTQDIGSIPSSTLPVALTKPTDKFQPLTVTPQTRLRAQTSSRGQIGAGNKTFSPEPMDNSIAKPKLLTANEPDNFKRTLPEQGGKPSDMRTKPEIITRNTANQNQSPESEFLVSKNSTTTKPLEVRDKDSISLSKQVNAAASSQAKHGLLAMNTPHKSSISSESDSVIHRTSTERSESEKPEILTANPSQNYNQHHRMDATTRSEPAAQLSEGHGGKPAPLTASPSRPSRFVHPDEPTGSTHTLRTQAEDSTSFNTSNRSPESVPEKPGKLTQNTSTNNSTTSPDQSGKPQQLTVNPPTDGVATGSESGAFASDFASKNISPQQLDQGINKPRKLSVNVPRDQVEHQPSSTNSVLERMSDQNSLDSPPTGPSSAAKPRELRGNDRSLDSPLSELHIASISSQDFHQLAVLDTSASPTADSSANKPGPLTTTRPPEPFSPDHQSELSENVGSQRGEVMQPAMTLLKPNDETFNSHLTGRHDTRDVCPENRDNTNHFPANVREFSSSSSLSFSNNDEDTLARSDAGNAAKEECTREIMMASRKRGRNSSAEHDSSIPHETLV